MSDYSVTLTAEAELPVAEHNTALLEIKIKTVVKAPDAVVATHKAYDLLQAELKTASIIEVTRLNIVPVDER